MNIAIELVQFVMMGSLLLLVLALMRVVGAVTPHPSTEPSQTLRTWPLADADVFDVRQGTSVPVVSLLDGRHTLLLGVSPGCTRCDDRLKDLERAARDADIPAIVIVRSSEAGAAALARQLSLDIAVVLDDAGLGLAAYTPPFAAVIEPEGAYSWFTYLDSSDDFDRTVRIAAGAPDRRAAQRAVHEHRGAGSA